MPRTFIPAASNDEPVTVDRYIREQNERNAARPNPLRPPKPVERTTRHTDDRRGR